MRKRITAVIGANFGDEGKGLMTDYFCGMAKGNVLNVRFNGGAQAGHTVVTPEGHRHVFGHIGAGSFLPNASTYLTRDFVVNPMMFWREYDALKRLGIEPKVYVHRDCKVSTPYDMLINQILEDFRGGQKGGHHGSCGIGVFETELRSRGEHKFTIGEIAAMPKAELVSRLYAIKDVYAPHRLCGSGVAIDSIPEGKARLLGSETVLTNWVTHMTDMIMLADICEIADDAIMDKFSDIVFEGAQGLQLDQHNDIYFPHLTPSSTGIKNVIKALNDSRISENADIEACYVTRTYFTRHGAGMFPSECAKADINPSMVDMTNKPNMFQGNLRYGWFDLDAFAQSIGKDKAECAQYSRNYDFSFAMAVTHLNETDGNILTGKGKSMDVSDFADGAGAELGFAKVYTSNGMTRDSVTCSHRLTPDGV